MPSSRRVLGIDPGSRYCGYGVIGADGSYVSSGTLQMTLSRPLDYRLNELYEGLTSILDEFSPTVAAVEQVFFARSVKAALSLGHARGVVLFSLAQRGIEVFEYAPLEIKKAVTGYGRAEKSQVQEMVSQVLGLNFKPSTDGADALAAAICHKSLSEYKNRMEQAG